MFKWKGTQFTLNALPIGGFVRPKGEMIQMCWTAWQPPIPGSAWACFCRAFHESVDRDCVMSIIIAQAGVGVEGKVLISKCFRCFAAQQAGIKADDILLAVNGKSVSTLDEARALIRAGWTPSSY